MSEGVKRFSLIHPDPALVKEDLGAKSISFFVRVWPILIDAAMIEEMKQVSARREHRMVRICLHGDPKAAHHDMVILDYYGRYFPPHRHQGYAETFHVIEGKLGVVSYNDDGEVMDADSIGPGQLCRLAVELYHFVVPLSDMVIYHESKAGPFLGAEDLIIPDWAPRASEVDLAARFLARAHELLRRREDKL